VLANIHQEQARTFARCIDPSSQEDLMRVLAILAWSGNGLVGLFRSFPLVGLAVLCVLFPLLLRGPGQLYWELGFEGLALYKMWPVALLLLLAAYWFVGWYRHLRTGLAWRAPIRAIVVVLVALWGASWWIDETAADWSLGWCAAALVCLAVAASLAVRGGFAYTEVWRSWTNPLAGRLKDDLKSGAFLAETQRRVQKVQHLPWWVRLPKALARFVPGARARSLYLRTVYRLHTLADYLRQRQWGSEHCLTLVNGHYEACRGQLLEQLSYESLDPGAVFPAFQEFARAGESLVAYLLLDWPESVFPAEDRSWAISHVRREILTLGLWLELNPNAARAQVDRDRLLQSFIDSVPAGASAYGDLFQQLFRLAFHRYDPARSRRLVAEVLAGFQQILTQPTRGRRHLGDLAGSTWLALSTPLPEQLRLDVWLAMRRAQSAVLDVPGPGSKLAGTGNRPRPEAEVCHLPARLTLARLYQQWGDRIPEEWQAGLLGRARHAHARTPGGQWQVIGVLLQPPRPPPVPSEEKPRSPSVSVGTLASPPPPDRGEASLPPPRTRNRKRPPADRKPAGSKR
jgi:hypothetical protein